MKKLLFSFGTAAAFIVPVATSVSCGSKTHHNHEVEVTYVPTLSTELANKTQNDHLALWDNFEWVTPQEHWFDGQDPKAQPYVVQLKATAQKVNAVAAITALLDDIEKVHNKISEVKLSEAGVRAFDKVQYVLNQINFQNKCDKDGKNCTISKPNTDYINLHIENAAIVTNVAYQLMLPLVSTIDDKDSAYNFLVTVLANHTSNNNAVTDEGSFEAYKAKADETIAAKLAIFNDYLNI